MNNQLMFFIFAALILIFSVMTVTTRRILRSAVFLLFVLLSTAGIYYMLSYTFLAAVQLTVYAGGIVVLIIFSILLTSHISERASMAGRLQAIFSAAVAILGAGVTLYTIYSFAFKSSGKPAIASNVKNIGAQLTETGKDGYALPFEVISVLLLAAMIGAIVVARKESKQENK
jgi:NADH-quinone oxidoreductase subunit J